jgi:hypothetical protein
MERGRPKAHDPREQVGEEAGDLAQEERVLGFYASELPEEGEGEDLRVREPLEGGVAASSFGVESAVDIVHPAEQNDYGLFQEGELWGMLGLGHLWYSFGRDYYGWPSFYLTNHAIHI